MVGCGGTEGVVTVRWREVDTEGVEREHGEWLALAHDEVIEFAGKTVRDLLIFTDRRVIVTDTQGFIRKKTEYTSIPYGSITRWSVESKRGLFDGADLKIWLSSLPEPVINVELQRDESAQDIMEMFAEHLLHGTPSLASEEVVLPAEGDRKARTFRPA
ncbi:MAG: PH domain-containing protein [Chloroflexota bacterium]|nr:PH domain-containing protein [Chloroflexota bacterium]